MGGAQQPQPAWGQDMTRGTTWHAIRRAAEITSPKTGEFAAWLFSPPTPETPEPIEADAQGNPPADATTVVDCGGKLYDRIVLHRTHRHTLLVPRRLSPMLEAFFALWWEKHETDDRPENREVRAQILALAAEADDGAEADRRRAWRVIDWQVRENAPVVLELAGFGAHADAYRRLPEIVGPKLPREAVQAFRAAHRDTDRASSAVVRNGGQDRRPWLHAGLAWHLERAARLTIPGLEGMLAETYKTKMTPLALGLLAKGYARTCAEWSSPGIPLAARKRARAQLDAGSLALVREVIGMGTAKRRAAA